MPNPKVVQLQPDRKPSSALPPIVSSVRQQSRRQLLALVKDLLNGTDDALFEMADRSQNNTDHNLYFDSMRQIRLHRGDIEKEFVDEFNQGFDQSFASGGGLDSLEEVSADDISLVQNDELEISVAISGIVSKITSQFSLPIMELTKRLDHLAKHATIGERHNPLGPQMVSEAFASAIESVDIDIKIRIILMKLFERIVMQRMGSVYEEANRTLVEAGVLRDLRRASSRRNPQRAARPSSNASQESAGADRDGNQGGAQGYPGGAAAPGFGHGQASHGHGGGGPAFATGVSGNPGAGAGGGAAGQYHPDLLEGEELSGGRAGSAGFGVGGQGGVGGAGMGPGSPDSYGAAGGFGAIQSLLAGSRGPATPTFGEPVLATPDLLELLSAAQSDYGHQPMTIEEVPTLLDVHQVVVSRARDVTGEAINHLGRADEDVVNFIGMLFDYILNDRNLAIPMKALIARLQIPVVKLAILDKSFFDRASHPARQLLNELSSTGIGWSSAAELKRDAVYDKIESIVIRVLNGFSDNPQIFEELLDELRTFRATDTVRRERMEQRVKEKESGRARTLQAKQEVQKVINQKASGLRLPRELGRFLSDVWSRVMVYVSVKEGTASASWEALMSILDELLWALQPLDDMHEIDQRDGLKEALIRRMRAGMDLVQLSENDQEHWCQLITEQLDEVSRNDRAFLEDDEIARSPEVFPEMEEIILASPFEVTDSYQGEAPEPDFIEKINMLSEGCWVEAQHDGAALRCKLAAIVKPGDRYVFVNRRGMKVLEKTRMELARELQDDQLVMLNDAQVFDRALEAVIGNLRQMHKSEG